MHVGVLMRSYELIAILRTQKQEEDKTLSSMDELLGRFGVRTSLHESWGERKLHHPAKGVTKGFFVYRNCKLAPDKLKDLTRDLRLEPYMLQFMFKRLS